MITINLLPQEFRKAEKKETVPVSLVIVGVVVVMVVLHVLFGVLGLYKKAQLAYLEKKWTGEQAHFKEVSDLKKELEEKKRKADALKGFVVRDVYWTDFFNTINRAVPKGLWLNRLSVSDQGLVIEGSVFSFNIDQVALVNKFFDELKKDAFFRARFTNFSLDSVQRRSIKQYEILDFLLTAKLTEGQLEGKAANAVSVKR